MSAVRPRARLAVIAGFAALGALFAANERAAGRDRAAPGQSEVDRDVAPARAELAAALTAMERTCSAAAEAALLRTSDAADASALFSALADPPPPAGAGLFVEDAAGRVLAWAGATLDDSAFAAMPRDGDGTWLVTTPASRHVAVRRVRPSPPAAPGAPVLAVCHLPFAESSPLRSRAAAPPGLEQRIAGGFRVAEEVRVLAADAADGEPVPGAFGGTLARIDVRPLSARSWDEAVEAAAGRRRTAILAALLAAAAAVLWRLTGRVASPRTRHTARAALVLSARAALGLLPISDAADLGALTGAGGYAHPLPVDVAGSPLSLLLTCSAACAAAACLLRAARDGPPRPGPAWRTLAFTIAAALLCRAALAELAGDVVTNSRVDFLPAETILPGAAPAALLAALLAAGVAAVFLVETAWTIAPPAGRLSPQRALGASLLVAAALAPLGPAGPHAVPLALVAVAGFAAALCAAIAGSGVAVRAAAVPVGVAAALFSPLAGELHAATRTAVEREAEERVARTVAAERLFVADTLESAAQDPQLLDALRAGRLPRDLALSLWSKSPLARRTGGSSLEIVPLAGAAQRFGADLPPAAWLPDRPRCPGPGEAPAEPLPGRGPGADGRWIAGETDVAQDGRSAATLRVVLEVRPPAAALTGLRILGASRAPGVREPPALAVTRYAPDGRLVDTDDPYRPAGAPLDADLFRAAVEERREVWRPSRSDPDIEVFVRPDVEDGAVTAVHAFSYDTGGTRALLLGATRAALCGALVSLAALLVTARSWARRVRLRLAQRLAVSYVLVAALPLLVLGWANRQLALQRADETTRRELTEAISLLRAALHERGGRPEWTDPSAPRGGVIDLRDVAYAIGRHANVYAGGRLVAASDPSLFDAELLPTRLPGAVHRDVVLMGRPFEVGAIAAGGHRFDVGYAPLRSESHGGVIGAVSVPLLHQERLRDRELASALTAVLGIHLASLVAAVAAGTWLAGRMTKPLSDLTDAARRVASGDVERPVPGAGQGELGEVVAAFNQMQRDLGESRAQLVRAEKEAAWRDMARQVAHEVKNPLTPMRLAAEHLRRAWRDKVPQFGDVLERGVDLIVRQTETLQRIAAAFGDFARFPNRRRVPVDVPALADEVLDLYALVPELEIRRRIERPLPALAADPDELRRVLVNLVKNAVEALEGGKGVLTVTLARSGDSLVLTLEDDGPGIPAEVLPRLFEPYLSTKENGTGLGLALCKRAVEDLSGTIEIASPPGAGTTVTVRLPLAPDGAGAGSQPE